MKKLNLNIQDKLDKIVYIYLIITLFTFMIFSIAPFVNILLGTVLYSMQTYLGIIGLLLILVEFINNNNFYKKNYLIFLYIIIAITIISSILTINTGLKENIFSIAWLIIYVGVFFTYYNRKKVIEIYSLYKMLANFWIVTSLISIFLYIYNIGYYEVTNLNNSSFTRQGFLENRLFGIYMSINKSSLIEAILIIIGTYYFLRYKKKYIMFYNIVFLTQIVLSGSRTSLLGLYIVLFFSLIYYSNKILKGNKRIIRYPKSILASLCIVIITVFSMDIYKSGLSYIPNINFFKNNHTTYIEYLSKFNGVIFKNSLNNDMDSESEDILSRKDISKGNVSNNRFDIWKDYISLYEEIGLIGLSPNNYSKILQKNNDDKYIVSHIKENYPQLYKSGYVYHPHNGYLLLYVSTGVIGLVSFLTLIILIFKDTIIIFKKKIFIESEFYMILLVVLFCLVSIVFDSGIFFENDIVTLLFWLFLGYIVSNKRILESRKYANNKTL